MLELTYLAFIPSTCCIHLINLIYLQICSNYCYYYIVSYQKHTFKEIFITYSTCLFYLFMYLIYSFDLFQS